MNVIDSVVLAVLLLQHDHGKDLDTAFVERSEAVYAQLGPILTRLVDARLHLHCSKALERKVNSLPSTTSYRQKFHRRNTAH